MMTRSYLERVDLRHSADQVFLQLRQSLENLGLQIWNWTRVTEGIVSA